MGKYKSHLLVLVIFVAFNIAFNFQLWRLLFSPVASDHFPFGESALAEFTLESGYRNVLRLQNPYLLSDSFFYPYQVNLSINDPGIVNLFFFILLRPFASTDTAMLLLVLFNNILTSGLMYLLLRRMKITSALSTIFALCFSFTPYISHRIIGHYIYTSLYVFPLTFLLIYSFVYAKERRKKLLLSLGIGLMISFVLLLNLYYFITILLAIIFYGVYFLLKKRTVLFQFILANYRYGLPASFASIILLLPWLYAVARLVRLEGFVRTAGLGGAVELSADVFSLVTPSEYNPLYSFIIFKLSSFSDFFAGYKYFFLHNRQSFAYPGILVLLVYALLIIYRRKLPRKLKTALQPHLVVSLTFLVLMLGPFLKIINRWSLVLQDGIALIFPLPFLLLQNIPGFGTLRAPTRFTPVFVFLSCIVGALLVNYLLARYSAKKKIIILGLLLLVVALDQFYVIPPRPVRTFPLSLYQYIKKDRSKFSVLEIPFTVRDGFDYLGFVHAIQPLTGQLLHRKPIIGGYTARVHPAVFAYYKNLPFIGYLSRIIDKGNYNPEKEAPGIPLVVPFTASLESAKRELDFLAVKYVLLKNDELYSEPVRDLLIQLGFRQELHSQNYFLFQRMLEKNNFVRVDFGSDSDYLHIGQGFSFREDGFRWAEGKLAKVFIKTDDTRRTKLVFSAAAFYQPQDVQLYLNEDNLATLTIDTKRDQYTIELQDKLKIGINTFVFRLSKTLQPATLNQQDKDTRELGLQFFFLQLE